MSELVCPFDGHPGEPGKQFCRPHKMRLVPSVTETVATTVNEPTAPEPAAAQEEPANCWFCSRPLPDGDGRCSCSRPRTPPPLVLRTPDGSVITVAQDAEAGIGRHPDWSSYPTLFPPTVSRRHATVGVGSAGPWIRPAESTHGTTRNGTLLQVGVCELLGNGDRIGLGTEFTLTVSLYWTGQSR